MGLRAIISERLWIKARYAKASVQRCLFRFLWVFPVDKRKIVFSNFDGKGYGDNPKYIAEEFAKRKKGKLYWLCKDEKAKLPHYIIPIKYGSLASLYHLATAAVWVDNKRKKPYISKRRKQHYIQTWHGSIPLKRIEADVEDSLDIFYVSNAKRDSGMMDLIISDSKFSDRLYREGFWYDGKVLRVGTPRFDYLADLSNKTSLRNSLDLPQDAFVILYAPTFRNQSEADVYDIDLKRVKSAFETTTRKKAVILVRMHPNIPVGQVKYDENIAVDVSDYPDVYDLLKMSDVLITDYSSLIFEFSVVEMKPVFAYAKDLYKYDRGFYFSLDSLPFLFATSNDELIKGILEFDQDSYIKKLRSFYDGLELIADGHASERVVDYIVEKGWVD